MHQTWHQLVLIHCNHNEHCNHLDPQTIKHVKEMDGFCNPLLDTSDTSTIHVWKGQNGHSLSAYFLSWSSDSVVSQDKGLAGLVFKV